MLEEWKWPLVNFTSTTEEVENKPRLTFYDSLVRSRFERDLTFYDSLVRYRFERDLSLV